MTTNNKIDPKELQEEVDALNDELEKVEDIDAENEKLKQKEEENDQDPTAPESDTEGEEDTDSSEESDEDDDEQDDGDSNTETSNDESDDSESNDGQDDGEGKEKEPDVTEPDTKGKDKIDYKQRHADSTREGQILYARTQKMQRAIEEAANLPDPTEDELKSAYDTWDDMSDFERQMATEGFINKRYRAHIQKTSDELKDEDAWNGKVVEFVEDPKTLVDNPELEGKTEEFRLFASKPTRRGLDWDDLVPLFLSKYREENPKKKNKGAMFERSSGNRSDGRKPKDQKLSYEEGRKLRQTNYALYKQKMMAGQIDDGI